MYTFDDRIVSDLHKDARGFRPSQTWFANWSAKTDDEKQATWDSLCDEVSQSIEEEREREAQDLIAFYAEIEATKELCNCSEADAIRYMAQAEGLDINGNTEYCCPDQDFEHFLWNKGILFTAEGRELVSNFREGRFA